MAPPAAAGTAAQEAPDKDVRDKDGQGSTDEPAEDKKGTSKESGDDEGAPVYRSLVTPTAPDAADVAPDAHQVPSGRNVRLPPLH
mmetsp:Transcript_60950/g.144012  ORF Transcript_60950/g.144012 Transcript_60950/m.144012 type:complete len:85 (+) Transcript_60950:702-956(+)